MKKHKKYEIKTIEDIANAVTEKNLDNFIDGLKDSLNKYLATVKLTKSIINTFVPEEKKNNSMKNTDYVGFDSIVYIDDNKQENTIEINLK